MKSFIMLCAAAFAWATTLPSTAGEYKEDFNDGTAQNWAPQNPKNWKVVGTPGSYMRYRAKSAKAEGAMVSTYAAAEFSDFVYRTFVRNDETYASYMIFRATSDFWSDGYVATGSGYAFGLDADCDADGVKSFYIYKVVNGTLETIQSWTESPAIQCDEEGNVLKVRATGDRLKFYINHALVYEYTDPMPVLAGRVGMLGYSFTDGPTTHWFDRTRIKPLTAEEAAATTGESVSATQKKLNARPSSSHNPASAR